MRLASRFGYVNQIRRERPLTREELMYHVPSIFGEDRHTSRSERYAYIPTITVLENLQREGFQPFFACQTRVRDQSRREYTKHMLRLRGKSAAGRLSAVLRLPDPCARPEPPGIYQTYAASATGRTDNRSACA